MKKSFIVEDVRANLDKITCLTDEIKDGIDFRCLNAIGVWHVEGKNNDAMEVNLWDKVEAYILEKKLGKKFMLENEHCKVF